MNDIKYIIRWTDVHPDIGLRQPMESSPYKDFQEAVNAYDEVCLTNYCRKTGVKLVQETVMKRCDN